MGRGPLKLSRSIHVAAIQVNCICPSLNPLFLSIESSSHCGLTSDNLRPWQAIHEKPTVDELPGVGNWARSRYSVS